MFKAETLARSPATLLAYFGFSASLQSFASLRETRKDAIDQALADAGNSATNLSDTVSSSSWKCGLRNAIAL